MAEARQRDEWTRTSSILLILRNAHRNPKKGKPVKWKDVFPFKEKKNRAATETWNISDVANFFPLVKQGGARKKD